MMIDAPSRIDDSQLQELAIEVAIAEEENK